MPPQQSTIARQQIECLVDRIAELSKSPISASEFHDQLIRGAVDALGAVGGAVWLTDETPGGVTLETAINCPPEHAGSSFGFTQNRVVATVLRTGRAETQLAEGADDPPGHGPNHLLLACPVRVGGDIRGILVLVHDADLPPAARANALRVLEALAEAAGDFHQGLAIRQLSQWKAEQFRWDEFSAAVQGSLDLRATAFTIVNDGRLLVGCDRMWVLTVHGPNCRAIAISGCDSIERGAESIRAMEQLAAAVAVVGEPLDYFGGTAELAPALESRLQTYLDTAHSRQLALLPIAGRDQGNQQAPDSPIAIVVAESFASRSSEAETRRRLAAVVQHSEAALRHACELQAIPGMSLLRRLGRSRGVNRRRRLSRWASVACALLVAVLALSLIPSDFSVPGRGKLQPKLKRDLFAPRDAVVEKVLVAQGDAAPAGGVLMKLKDHTLDFEQAKVVAEIQATQQQLQSVRAERVGGAVGNTGVPQTVSRLAADEETLEKRLAGLKRQRLILQNHLDQLELRSPIAGQVLTRDVTNQWQERPVRQGERLLEVADTKGAWILELDVSDRDIRHVQAAREDGAGDLRVTFLLATDLETVYEGRVESVALTAESREGEPPAVRVTVRVDDAGAAALKPGASVVARIDCGRKPLGYVWLREFVDAVRQWWLF